MASSSGYNCQEGDKPDKPKKSDLNVSEEKCGVGQAGTTRDPFLVPDSSEFDALMPSANILRLEKRFESINALIREEETAKQLQLFKTEVFRELEKLKQAKCDQLKTLTDERNFYSNLASELEGNLARSRDQIQMHEKRAFQMMDQDEIVLNDFIYKIQALKLEKFRSKQNYRDVVNEVARLTKSEKEMEENLIMLLNDVVYPTVEANANKGIPSRRDTWLRSLMKRYPPKCNHNVPVHTIRPFEDTPDEPVVLYYKEGSKVPNEECKIPSSLNKYPSKKGKTVPKEQLPVIAIPNENEEEVSEEKLMLEAENASDVPDNEMETKETKQTKATGGSKCTLRRRNVPSQPGDGAQSNSD